MKKRKTRETVPQRRRKQRTWAGLLATLVLILASAVQADALFGGGEFQVNSTVPGEQGYASIAHLTGGGFIVAWESEGQDGSGNGVAGQLLNSSGSPVGTEFLINSFTALAQDAVVVVADAAGGFIAVWESDGQDGSNKGVFARHFDASGTPMGSEFQVNVFTTLSQDDPAIATDAAGSIVVVWESVGQDGDLGGIFGRRFDSSGSPLGTEFQANTFTLGPQVDPAVGMDAAGNFVVVWGSIGQDGSASGVFAQRFDSSGTPVGTEFRTNTFTAGGQDEAAVAVDSAGNFVVLWESFGQDGSTNGVFGQLYQAGGLPAGTEFQVNAYTTYSQDDVSASFDSTTGDFLVVWESVNQDGGIVGNNGVFARRFDGLAIPLEDEFQVNVFTTGGQDDGVASIDSDGNFVVVWTSSLQDGSDDGIFARRFAASLCPSIPDTGCRLGQPGRSGLQIKDKVGPKDQLKWKLNKGDATDLADFLDPLGSSSATLRLCLYDQSAAAQPLLEADIPPQGTCGTKPCWKTSGTTGFKYKNKTALPNGIRDVKLKAGVAGKSQVSVKGKGGSLATPALPLTFPVTAQLIITDGASSNCWQNTFSTFTKNNALQVKAKGP